MVINTERYIAYDTSLKPCPFCGSTSQEVSGVLVGNDPDKWSWNVRCNACQTATGIRRTEKEAIEAWQGRYKENEVEQDGYSTWRDCLDRFVWEGISRFAGTDRPDTGSSDGE